MGATNNLIVGINGPWCKYGHDFGPPITSVSGASATKPAQSDAWDTPLQASFEAQSPTLKGVTLDNRLEIQLDLLKTVGIQVVRWFLLADGWIFGTPRLENGKWSYAVPSVIDPAFISRFKKMLQSFQKMGMQIIPVLLDYKFFLDGQVDLGKDIFTHEDVVLTVDKNSPSVENFVLSQYKNSGNLKRDDADTVNWKLYIKGGKAALLEPKNTDDFIRRFLDPLLDAADPFKKQIYAWDVCNEPDEAVQEAAAAAVSKLQPLDPRLLPTSLAAFLYQTVKRIAGKGFSATIGFKLQSTFDSYFPTTTPIGQSMRAMDPRLYLPQFHYYPEDAQIPDLNKQKPAPRSPASSSTRSDTILGEFATRFNLNTPDWWEQTWPKDVELRLQRLDELNFGCALLWAARSDLARSSWDSSSQAAVKNFLSSRS